MILQSNSLMRVTECHSNIIFVAPLARLNNVIRSFLVLLAPFDWQLSLIPVRFCDCLSPELLG